MQKEVKKPRILIGIPSSDLVQAKFMMSLLPMVCGSQAVQIDVDNQRSSRITANRNGIVETAKKTGVDYILFIDADMTFPPDALYRLLELDKDIACATATKRDEANCGQPIGLPFDKSEATTNKRLLRMEMVGMPFMLIKMKVFEKLSKPYFAEPVHNDDIMPEDNYFCETAQKAGFEIWCDLFLSTQMGHLGIKEYKIQPVPSPLKTVKAA